MTQVRINTDALHADSREGTVVRRPRPTDAIGNALRHAFTPDAGLPDHLARPLTALDRWR